MLRYTEIQASVGAVGDGPNAGGYIETDSRLSRVGSILYTRDDSLGRSDPLFRRIQTNPRRSVMIYFVLSVINRIWDLFCKVRPTLREIPFKDGPGGYTND